MNRISLKDFTAELLSDEQNAPELGFDDVLLGLHAKWLKRCLEFDDKLCALCTLNQWMAGFIDKPLGDQGYEASLGGRKNAFWGRKQHGSYYTPPDIVDFVVETCVLEPMAAQYQEALAKKPSVYPNPSRWLKLKVIDPAMGGGVFLLKTLEAIASAFETEFVDWAKRKGQCQAAAWGDVIADLGYLEGLKDIDGAWEGQALKGVIASQCLYGVDINPLALRVVTQSLQAIIGANGSAWAQNFVCANAIAPEQSDELSQNAVTSGCSHARHAYERLFPEVFARPNPGFDFVLLNPPWNKLVLNKREFFSQFAKGHCLMGDAKSRAKRIDDMRRDPAIEAKWQVFAEDFEQTRLSIHRASSFYANRRQSDGPRGHSDVYAFFLDLAYQIAREKAIIGAVLPNAFYANAGASIVRKYMLSHCAPAYLFGLNNAKEIFPDVSKALRFCLLKTQKRAPLDEVNHKTQALTPQNAPLETAKACPLAEPKCLECEGVACVFPSRRLGNSSEGETSPTQKLKGIGKEGKGKKALSLGVKPVDVHLGFGFSSILELRQAIEAKTVIATTAEAAFGQTGDMVAEVETLVSFEYLAQLKQAMTFGEFMDAAGLNLSQELNSTIHAPYFVDAQQEGGGDARLEPQLSRLRKRGLLPVYEKGSLAAYTPDLRSNVRYLFDIAAFAASGKSINRLKGHEGFRIACRSTIHASESKKLVFSLLAPGALVTNSALVEMHIEERSLEDALLLMAVANTNCLNEVAQKYIGTNMKRFLLRSLPFPVFEQGQKTRLAMMALRLSAMDERYFGLLKAFGQVVCGSETERRWLLDEIEATVLAGLKCGDVSRP